MKKIIKIVAIQVLILIIIFSHLMLKNNIVNFPAIHNSFNLEDKKETVNIESKSDLYISLENALLNGKTEISLINRSLFKDPDEIFKILETINNNNPKVMYYKGAKYSFGKLELLYSKPRKDILKHQKEIKNIKRDFLENHIHTGMTDYEKVLAIHDFIIKKGEYDKKLLNNEEVPPESYSSYGILSLGVGVCESYAKSMKYLLDGAGIESFIVVGKSRGENHAWNLVKLEGEYYHIDSTWNDPIVENSKGVLRYNFFNLNDKEMSITHEWDREKYPRAEGEKYNYYIYNNLIVRDERQLEKQIEDALLKGETIYTAKISNLNKEIKINEIIEKLGQKYYEKTGFNAYNYSIDEDKGIISIKLFYNL